MAYYYGITVVGISSTTGSRVDSAITSCDVWVSGYAHEPLIVGSEKIINRSVRNLLFEAGIADGYSFDKFVATTQDTRVSAAQRTQEKTSNPTSSTISYSSYSGNTSSATRIAIQLAVYVTELAPARYTLIYDTDGGLPEIGPQEFEEGIVTLSSITPSKTGYSFEGWGDEIGQQTADYQPGEQIELHSDKTIYAVWVEAPVPPRPPRPAEQLDRVVFGNSGTFAYSEVSNTLVYAV